MINLEWRKTIVHKQKFEFTRFSLIYMRFNGYLSFRLSKKTMEKTIYRLNIQVGHSQFYRHSI